MRIYASCGAIVKMGRIFVVCDRLHGDPPGPSERPVYSASSFHRPSDMLTQMLIELRLPGNELKTQAIVYHGEPSRCELQALTVGARYRIAFGALPVRQTGTGDACIACLGQLSRTQCA